jgi:hypothetical protein
MGENINAYRVLTGKPLRKRPFGRHRSRSEDNIKTDLKEMVWKGWTGFVWLRTKINGELLLRTVMNLRTK